MTNTLKKQINWGIVGSGHIASKFANDLLFLENHKVVAVSSRSLENANRFAEKYGATAIEGHKSILSQKVDCVYIATDTSLHSDLSDFFISKNIPVLCEKPFATSYSRALKTITLAREKNVPFMEAMWSQYLPIYSNIMKELPRLGEIVNVNIFYGRVFVKDPSFRLFDKNLGGGSLSDMGMYAMQILSSIFYNQSYKVFSFASYDNDIDETSSSIIKFEGGAIATITTSIVADLQNIAVISGTKGTLFVEDPFFDPPGYYIKAGEDIVSGKIKKYKGFGLREQAKYFGDMIDSKTIDSKVYGHDKMIYASKMLEKIRESHNE
jgi:predicted dehydrogenase